MVAFIKKLPSDYIGDIYSFEEKDYESKTKQFLQNYYLLSGASPVIITQKTPLGSKLYLSNSKDLSILTNYEDHFLLIFDFKSHSILKSLQKIELLLKIFEKTLQEIHYAFSQRNRFGYLTSNPNYTGLGISLNYTLKLREKGPNEMQIELNPE